ncbi:MAG: glycosyltransferase [Candidatus Moranbacteria bacterium]|nr:glycosyltransferase [Candidatus Moranbacteria bacterium]
MHDAKDDHNGARLKICKKYFDEIGLNENDFSSGFKDVEKIKKLNDCLLNDLIDEKYKFEHLYKKNIEEHHELEKIREELYEMKTSLRWRISNGVYKLYKKKIKKLIPKFVFRIKDFSVILFYRVIFLLRKINFKKIKNSIMRTSPSITIGIASYNHSKYLEKCIQSALDQDYKNYDILIVDDNSSDPKNREILKKYESNEKITIVYNKENKGISASLNSQVLNSKGEWVAFLDCDDYLPENALLEMAKHIENNPRLRLVYSNRIEVDENDKFLRKVWFGKRAANKNQFEDLLKGMVSSHLKIIHKDAFLKVGLFDPRFGGTHDYDMFLRVAFYMPKAFGFIDKYLYYHRIHGSQNTLVENEKHAKNVEMIIKEAKFRKLVYEGEFKEKVSMVILSFNRFKQLKNTVEKIKKNAKNINYEILIWDNGSTYGKVLEYLHTINGKSNIKVVFSKENLKAAGGRREATKLVNGDYVLYFDNDIEVAEHFLEEMVIRINESDDIASCCARIIFPDHRIQYTGGLIKKIDDNFIEFKLDNVGKSDCDLHTMIKRDYDWLGTGATMTKRKYLHLANFDSGFVNAYEDNDYYMQFVKHGLRIVHAPTASVVHHHVNYEIKRDPGTEKYVSVRHDKTSFINSWVHFYKKWNLIIKDDFIFGIADLKNKSNSEIKEFIENYK